MVWPQSTIANFTKSGVVPSPDVSNAEKGTVSDSRLARQSVIVWLEWSMFPPINRSELFVALKATVNSSNGRKPSFPENASRWKQFDNAASVWGVSAWINTASPSERVGQDTCFSKAS